MKKNIFKLKTDHLKEIALDLQSKIETGIATENAEVQCIPTFIQPSKCGVEGKATVLDLGGTNYRAAVVEITGGRATISPENGWSKDLSVMKTPGFTEEQLYAEQALFLDEIELAEKSPIGYCFSYPAGCMPNGDARLLRWTKGVDIKEMVGEPVGQPLVEYLNGLGKAEFTGVKVINDTVASLFAGLSDNSYDAYIGLIVGTGTNMAGFVKAESITKLNAEESWSGLLPVNLESGNFNPPYLTEYDDIVDAASEIPGAQRFEKAVSGMYLGRVFRAVFPHDGFDENFDARALTNIINHPDNFKKKHVRVARWIYKRSAKLVAASLAGLILVILSQDQDVKRVRLTAEGSLFWSKVKHSKEYNKLVSKNLKKLLKEFGHKKVKVDIAEMKNANLIGSAVAALS